MSRTMSPCCSHTQSTPCDCVCHEIDEHERLKTENERLSNRVKKLQEELTLTQHSNYRHNLELDALHYVWCDGTCESGIHRYGEHPALTADIVAAAERAVQRMRRKFVAMAGRECLQSYEGHIPTWRQADHDIHAAYVAQSEAALAASEAENRKLAEELKLTTSGELYLQAHEQMEAENRKLREALRAISSVTPLQLAVEFHVIYERLAAEYNYTTRTETRIFDPESANGKLMIAVCAEIVAEHFKAEEALKPTEEPK